MMDDNPTNSLTLTGMTYIMKTLKTLFMVVLLPFNAISGQNANPGGFIYGGQDVPYGQYPWTLKIEFFKKEDPNYVANYCTGILLNSNTVLTAAHCITDDYGGGQMLDNENDDGKIYPLSKIDGYIIDDSYIKDKKTGMDAAILHLVTPITRTYAPINTELSSYVNGKNGITLGYGMTAADLTSAGPTSEKMKMAGIKYVSTPGDSFIVAQGLDGANRGGDSGGPFLYNDQVIGVDMDIYTSAPTTNTINSIVRAVPTSSITPLLNKKIQPNQPNIISILPKSNDDKSGYHVEIKFTQGKVDTQHPNAKKYNIYYKWATDGDPWNHSQVKTIDATSSNQPQAVDLDLSAWDSQKESHLWAITILALDSDGTAVNADAATKKPQEGDKSNLTFLARANYSDSNDGWSAGIKESNSSYTCPSDEVMIGRSHFGDENATTYYRCTHLFVNSQLATYDSNDIIEKGVKESSGSWVDCPDNAFYVGRKHNGDENGWTTYKCAPFHFGTNKNRVVKFNQNTNGWDNSTTFKESHHQFSCGSNGKDQGDGSDHSTPPPVNVAMFSRKHSGDENGHTNYACTKNLDK
jgi:hypothetical protein